jgi:drug/metabolite transporter (DMT)-like permease
MSIVKVLGIVLIAAGVLGLLYGDFSFNKASHELKLGPLELSVTEKQTVPVPTWASLAAIGAGVALLAFGGGKKG